jgi:MHS family proline/betaine transporter-like MFS transporter
MTMHLEAKMASEARPSQARQSNFKLIMATSLGSGLEVYDNTIFSYFAIVIGQQFFAPAGDYGALLLSVSVFAIGFLIRPLGSLYFGSMADRRGRKSTLLLTIMLMALGVLLITLCPPYSRIGVAAPIILLVGRLLQGFSLGGEFGAATTLAMESSSPHSRGHVVSWQTACQGAATLAGALVAFTLTKYVPPEQFHAWGWRVGFAIGLSIAPVGLYIRSHMSETFDVTQAAGTPLTDLWKGYRCPVMLGILMMLLNSSLLYIVVLYMPTYLMQQLHFPSATSYLASIVSSAVLLIAVPLSGMLADRMPRRKPILLVSMLLPPLLVYPLFAMLANTQALWQALLLMGGMMAVASLGSGAFLLLLLEAFPAKVRASALSIIYSIGVSVVGGCAQLFVTWLIKFSGDPMSPAWFMMGCGAISYTALLMFREQKSI